MTTGITGRIARASAGRPWRTIGVWAAVLVVAFYFAGTIDQYVTSEVRNLTTTESDAGFDLNEEYRLGTGGDQFVETIIVTNGEHIFAEPEFADAIGEVVDAVRGVEGVIAVAVPELGDPISISLSGRSALLTVTTEGDTDVIAELIPAVEGIDVPGFVFLLTGEESGLIAFDELATEQLERGEMVGVITAIVILVVVFGALAAAGLPLAMALVSILSAFAIASIVGRFFELSDGVVMLGTMFGLALGIDYSLVAIQRFREELAKGQTPLEAITVTGATANRSIVVSGAAVAVSIGGLAFLPSTMLVGIALGVIFVAVTAVCAALTLLPAVLRILGHRVNKGRVPTAHPEREPVFWRRLARAVVARPAVSALAGLAVLGILIAPVASMRLASSGPEDLPEDFVVHQANDVLVQEFGWGQSSTIVAIEGATGNTAAIGNLADAIESDPAFAGTAVDVHGDVAFIDTHDLFDSADRRADEAIERLRTEIIPDSLEGTGAVAYVAGDQARLIDEIDLLGAHAWKVILAVLGASFLILLLVFRSIVIPLKAITLNLLGTAAAFGAMVAAYQWGWGNALFGFPEIDGISPYMPVSIFAMLFGLSMDYHVFLLSRIKERHDAGDTDEEAIVFGLSRTGSLITGAAIIMVAVFGGFAAASIPEMSQWGFGLAFAVLLDATIIRVLLVPSFMAWIGNANWYLPSWLQWLPQMRIEVPKELEASQEREPALV